MEVPQLINEAINWVYFSTLFIAVIYSIVRFNKLDRAGKYICGFIWLSFLTESMGWAAAFAFANNLPVYTISNILELCIISLYFNNSVRKLNVYHIGVLIGITGVVLGGLNIVLLQPINTLNSNFVFIECIVVVCLCLYSIFTMLMSDEEVTLHKEFHFWIICILLFYQCASLGNWGLLNYFIEFLPDKLIFWHIALVLVYTITYISLIILFYYYPKLKKTDV